MASIFKNLIENFNLTITLKIDSFRKRGSGGSGGKATVSGNGTAIGGPGGKGGQFGQGGKGGDAHVKGDGFAAGGEGGEAGQFNRGGKGGRSGAEIAGVSNRQLPDGSWLWDYGRGGDGASLPPTTEK